MEYILAHRDEPEELAATHWTFEARMKPVLDSSTDASDLRPYSSPRQNQRNVSDCASEATIKAMEILRIKRWGREAHVDLSRLACYFLARELMDPPETNVDKGSYISLNAEVLRRFGTCREELWPFDEKLVFTSPPWSRMRSAYKNRIQGWTRVSSFGNNRVDAVIQALANGLPIVYGTPVGENWMHYTSTSEPLDCPKEIKGRHATVLVGWDPSREVFFGENSWGTRWGQNGYYEIRPSVISWEKTKDFVVLTDTLEKIIHD